MKDGWAAGFIMAPAIGFWMWSISTLLALSYVPQGFVNKSMVAIPMTIFWVWAILRFMEFCLDKGFKQE